ncbi:hypothetical protein Cni_G26354 [Canna indica]|uniref:Glucan endo-1,3-beta-D-glucosidase n=1 Tax=Canna indica TaxID=4628 RepID=A0AAQ3L3K8_9LILI|nr:hypothetical protein Cni_G26354 [Canna indica]
MLTAISKLRLYGSGPAIIQSLVGTAISLVINVFNSDVASFASDPSVASSWVAANVLPYIPASSISVGNEALNSGDPSLASNLLPVSELAPWANLSCTASSQSTAVAVVLVRILVAAASTIVLFLRSIAITETAEEMTSHLTLGVMERMKGERLILSSLGEDANLFDPSLASSWVAANILPYIPASSISVISVGNEALNSGDPSLASNLLPAI